MSRHNNRSNQSHGNRTVVYTDGSCLNNGQDGSAGGYGYHCPEQGWGGSQPLTGRPTNQRAELQGAREAIERASQEGNQRIEIRTDSRYVQQGMTEWMPNWQNNGYKNYHGQPVQNQQDFAQLQNTISDNNMDVKFTHVPGHSSDPGNARAHNNAQHGARGNNYRY